MSLTGRFSTLFLAVLGVVLVGFSTALYVSARIVLHRQIGDRLAAALSVLADAAEVHPEGVEWEPQERVLPLGQEPGDDRLRWMVFDGRGQRVDHSRNLASVELTADWTPRPGTARLPARLVDRRGHAWRVSQSRIGTAAALREESKSGKSGEAFYPSLVLTVCAPIDPTEATLATLSGLLLGLSVVIWLLAALLCRRLLRQALTPLTRLAGSARGLDAADAGWRLEEAGTGDELDELGRAFNDLLSRLHVAYDRQRRFSSDASHQLRTPLTVLIGQIEVALRHERSGEEYRRALRSALGRAVQLGQIVEALLFLGRADADARLPECTPLELNHWIAENLVGRTGAEIVPPAAQAAPLWVRAHPPLLGQLLDNLLDNARKYGGPGPTLLVEALREGENAVLAVEDRGPGIPTEDVPHLFEPFYRSAQARRQGVPGAGLGLSIVQRIAVAFGGSVSVRSEVGRGARFEVRLPIAQTAPGSWDVAEHGLLAENSSGTSEN